MLLKYFVLFLVTILNCCSFGNSKVCCPTVNHECFFKRFHYKALPNPDCPAGNLEPGLELYNKEQQDSLRFSLTSIPWDKLKGRSLYRFIVHERRDRTRNENLLNLKNQLLYKEDANVILVDWHSLSDHDLPTKAATNTRTLGAYMALFFEKIMEKQSNAKIWCIGHGMGAHACAQAAQRKKIDRITGLDPTGQFFDTITEKGIGLSPDDADFVDVIHTNSREGTANRRGHADFYANGLKFQPPCGTYNEACNHEIAINYLTQSLENKCGKLWKCTDFWFDFNCTKCPTCFMGYDADRKNHGIFWATVNAEEPYCTV